MGTQTGTSKSGAVDRRLFLKRAGTVAWLTPAILTLSTKAAYASHCLGFEATCGTNSAGVCTMTGTLFCCTQCNCTPFNKNFCKCTGTCPPDPS